jgi:hypothetical protein
VIKLKTAQSVKIARRDLEVAASSVIGVAAYVHYLQLFILKITLPTLIAGVVFGTIYLILSVGLAKSVKIFYLLGIIFPFAGATLAVIRLHLYGFEVFSVINIGFDVFVVPACAFLFIKYRRDRLIANGERDEPTNERKNL